MEINDIIIYKQSGSDMPYLMLAKIIDIANDSIILLDLECVQGYVFLEPHYTIPISESRIICNFGKTKPKNLENTHPELFI